jgi:dihydroxyacetone kinase
MELAIVARHALAVLEDRGLTVPRVYLGAFLTSLEMAGVSLTVLPVDDERLRWLDAPTDAPAWPNAAARPRTAKSPAPPPAAAAKPATSKPATGPAGKALVRALEAACQALIDNAARLTELDQHVGDGDLGISLERGARAILAAMPGYPLDDPGATLHEVGVTVQRALGGTSGPLYAILLVRAAATLKRGDTGRLLTWAEAFRAGCGGLSELGGAKKGDRTMLDALLPAAEAFEVAARAGQSPREALQAAAHAAAAGVEATAVMLPRRGRSSYLGDRALGHIDPGAEAVAVWLRALADALA